eukprot:TRINITY_DN12194_c0_g1_i1.p1 TRINITY_DN12194_c0_g1~~TRINITY_DN12194_c0_g1_i1.p1  ORF type:complete len:530 (+),score=190.65 TRINITY_DN12194_c0_g1_i1:70-1659(+)
MISAVGWVKRGVAKALPERYKDPEEDDGADVEPLEDEMADEAEEKEDESMEEVDTPLTETGEVDIDKKYNLDDYDDEDNMPALSNFGVGRKVYKSNTQDPYITAPIENAQDMDDFMIRTDDNIILSATSEEEGVSHLDVFVYEPDKQNMYIHHDYLLPAFPLCIAWINYSVGGEDLSAERQGSNMCAVGTFEPYIEIWDLDMVDQPAPLALLGGPENPDDISILLKQSEEKNPKKKKKVKMAEGSHTDAVMSLSWNCNQKNLLASSSADKTVKLWDLNTGNCSKTYTNHTNKVSSVMWNPVEASILVSAGYDGHVILTDIRAPDTACMKIKFPNDVESVTWIPAPHHNHILTSTEDGLVHCFDILKEFSLNSALWKLQAHVKSTQAMDVSIVKAGADGKSNGLLLATGSDEKESPLKIWDITSGKPSCLYSKTEDVGTVFSLKFCAEDPFMLVVGSRGEQPTLVDTLEFPGVKHAFESYVAPTSTTTTSTSSSMNLEAVMAQAASTIANNAQQSGASSQNKKKKKKKKH